MYTLKDKKRQLLLDKMRAEDPNGIGEEIALLRVLIAEAAEDNPALVERLVSALARCQVAHPQAQVKAGALIEKQRLLALCTELAGLLSDALKANGIGDETHNAVFDYVMPRIMPMVESCTAKPLLEDQRGRPNTAD